MPSHKIIQIVAAESPMEKDEIFDKWYKEVHIPTLFEYKEVKEINRYRLKGDDKNCSRYLTIYEFDSEEDMQGFAKSKAFANAIKDFDDNHERVGFISRWFGIYELEKTMKR